MFNAPIPASKVATSSKVGEIIESAYRRRLLVITVEQLAPALTAFLLGFILLLLLGTQILSSAWLFLLASVAVLLTFLRVRSRLLTRYRFAQLLDRRLGLNDTLSTAHFLLSSPEESVHDFAGHQLQTAEQVACSINPAQAFPFSGQRTWALAGGFAAVAFGLFAVRYLVTSSLSLQQALVPIHLESVFEPIPDLHRKQPRQYPPQANKGRQTHSPEAAGPETGREASAPPLPPVPQAGQPDKARTGNTQNGQTKAPGDKAEESRPDSRTNSSPPDQPSANGQAGEKPASAPSPDNTPSSKDQPPNADQKPDGLVDKVKNALSSLMAKMRQPGESPKSQQNGEQKPDDGKTSDAKPSGKDGQQTPSPNERNQQAKEQQNSQAQAQGQTAEKAQGSPGRNSADQADAKGSDAHSGVGRQDGDKSLREAEQLRAMGKLAEIIGRRSASLTGEMTVETPSSKQQLKTAYSQKTAQHQDSGGEINRDEIPIADQQYVRDYMDQVHKQAKANQ